jgi:tetratricopeptide (TPR) repeat protein
VRNSKYIIIYSVFALLLFVAWRVLSLGLANHFAETNPDRALFWRSNHPEALYRAAEKSAENKQWPQAQQLAKRAVLANPLDGRALRIMAQVAEAEGNTKLALDLYQKASILAPRDLPSHIWLLDNALQSRQAEPAVHHLDAFLRLSPVGLSPDWQVMMQSQAHVLAVNPAAQPFMIQALSKNPPWRRSFLSSFSEAKLPLDDIAGFLNNLSKVSRLDLGEYQPWLNRLIAEQRYMQAYVTWAQLIPMKQRKYLGNVFDGGFEVAQEDQQGIFAWASPPAQGVQMYWANDRGIIGENAFFVNFEGGRTPFSNLQQTLVLPPGKWQLNYRARAINLDSTRGLIWRITCLPDNSTLAESEPMRGMFNWQELAVDFEVPEQCGGQKLQLLIPARIPAETQIRGDLWLDEVRIQPQAVKM